MTVNATKPLENIDFFHPLQRCQPDLATGAAACKIQGESQWAQIFCAKSALLVHRLPTKIHLADRRLRQELAGRAQLPFGYDAKGLAAHGAERGHVGERVIHIQQEQFAHAWRGLLPFIVYLDGLLVRDFFGVVFKRWRVW